MTRRKSVPAQGPEVFVPHDPTKGKTVVFAVGGKVLRARMPSERAPRDLTDEYCGTKQDTPPAGKG